MNTALKRLASAVQLRPWPPSNQALSSPQNSKHVPKRSNNLRTAAGVCLKGSDLQEVFGKRERTPSQRVLFVFSPMLSLPAVSLCRGLLRRTAYPRYKITACCITSYRAKKGARMVSTAFLNRSKRGGLMPGDIAEITQADAEFCRSMAGQPAASRCCYRRQGPGPMRWGASPTHNAESLN